MRIEQNRGAGSTLADLPVLSSRAGRALLCMVALLLAVFAWGCSGIVSGQNSTAAQTPPQTYSVSGTIGPATGGSGATVALSGAASASMTADSAGNYTFTGLANSTYVVTPSHTGYTFVPGTQSVTVSGANVTGVNFTATPQATHSVSLTWSASPTAMVAGYNVYRSTVSGSVYARVNTALIAGLAYTDSTVQNGVTYYFVTTAVDTSGNESVYSNQVSAAIP
jgi:hypothetical protein